jgi:hypothetical protein
MTRIRIIFSLFFLAAMLFAAGCESESAPAPAPASPTVTHTLVKITPRHTATTTIPLVETTGAEPEPVPETTLAKETEPLSSGTVAPPANYHPEYIRMDATTYSVGEVVQFYLVNKGSEIKGCDYAHPPYTVYLRFPDDTRRVIASGDPGRSYLTVISGEEIASSTGPFNLDTRKLTPGRYIIRFDCGNNVAREFVIMAHTPATGLI